MSSEISHMHMSLWMLLHQFRGGASYNYSLGNFKFETLDLIMILIIMSIQYPKYTLTYPE